MFHFTREWILGNQRRVRFYCGGELKENIFLVSLQSSLIETLRSKLRKLPIAIFREFGVKLAVITIFGRPNVFQQILHSKTCSEYPEATHMFWIKK